MTFPIIENAKRQAFLAFSGIAIPCDKSTVDGGTIRSEKVLKFNRKAMRELSKNKDNKINHRLIGGQDNMRFKIGKPGSPERINALILQYESLGKDEQSPFYE